MLLVYISEIVFGILGYAFRLVSRAFRSFKLEYKRKLIVD